MTTILLLAGLSRRMGRNKLLLPYRGRHLFEHTLEAAMKGSDRVICVTGNDRKQVEEVLAGYDVEVRFNPDYETGQKGSTLVGLEGVDDDVAILAGDYPLLTADDIREGFAILRDHPSARPMYREEPGHPVFLRAEMLKGLREDPRPFKVHLRELGIYKYQSSSACITDIDTPELYQALLDDKLTVLH